MSCADQATAAELSVDDIIARLREFFVCEVGTLDWADQQQGLERLNCKAHAQILGQADEPVSQALIASGKLSLLVRQLIVFEVWQEKVYPLLKDHLAGEMDSLGAYMLLYHAAVLANLLEVVLYHSAAWPTISEECLLELCDWCYRCLVYLATYTPEQQSKQDASLDHLHSVSPGEELDNKQREISFAAAISGLTILRYMADNVGGLPLGLTTRLCETNDSLMALIALLDRRPWEARRADVLHRFSGMWQPVSAAGQSELSQQDAQVWLLLHNLLLSPDCMAKCRLQSRARRERVAKLRERIDETLIDQLPILKGLRFVLEQLALPSPDDIDSKASHPVIVIEQVAGIREQLLIRNDWEAVSSAQQKQLSTSNAGSSISQTRMKALVDAFEQSCAQSEKEEALDVGKQGAVRRPVSVQIWSKVMNGMYKPWSDLSASIDEEPEAESIRLEVEPDNFVKGTRYRLKAFVGGALPSRGKVAVVHCGRSSEATLQLPTAPTRQACSQLAPTVWLTIGRLAAHGLAVQLKLKRVESAAIRDQAEGDWSAFQPVGGAVTLLDGH